MPGASKPLTSIPGVNVDRLVADSNSVSVNATADRFDREMQADQVSGTPAVYVGKTAGDLKPVTMPVVSDPSYVEKAVDAALA